jgi:putative aldouronate transport system permease protein
MKDGVGGLIFDICIYSFLILLLIVTLYPFLNIIAVSFNDAIDSLAGGIHVWPRIFTTFNYEQIFKDTTIIDSTVISVLRTVVGSLSTTACCFMCAYALSRKHYILRLFISRVFVFTMYFGGGLIPYYLLMKSLGLVGTFWVYIIPALVSAWNIMVMRSFIEQSIPDSLIESAHIDGASEFRTLLAIVTPLSVPVIATVILWTAVGQWNSWFDVYLYNNNRKELSTLQFELQKVLQKSMTSAGTSSTMNYTAGLTAERMQATTPQATRAAMTVVATVPILCAYPFLQRYFIHGLTLGGIKG